MEMALLRVILTDRDIKGALPSQDSAFSRQSLLRTIEPTQAVGCEVGKEEDNGWALEAEN